MTQLSHMNATAVLEHEHRSAETVVVTMSTIADHLEQGRRIDASLLTEVIFFLRIFAGQCQEAKEENLLFPALVVKCVSDSGCPVATLKNEHRKAGSLTLELLEAADAYAAGQPSAPNSLMRTLRALASLYREHIWKENHVLLPLAEQVLSAEEQDSLYEAFQGVEIQDRNRRGCSQNQAAHPAMPVPNGRGIRLTAGITVVQGFNNGRKLN